MNACHRQWQERGVIQAAAAAAAAAADASNRSMPANQRAGGTHTFGQRLPDLSGWQAGVGLTNQRSGQINASRRERCTSYPQLEFPHRTYARAGATVIPSGERRRTRDDTCPTWHTVRKPHSTQETPFKAELPRRDGLAQGRALGPVAAAWTRVRTCFHELGTVPRGFTARGLTSASGGGRHNGRVRAARPVSLSKRKGVPRCQGTVVRPTSTDESVLLWRVPNVC